MVTIPETEAVNERDPELTFPDTDNDNPVAAPNTGVTNVGVFDKTTDPEPVDDEVPVPPFITGNAVPEQDKARVPELVIGEPETDKKEGVVNDTDVTVPVFGVVHVIAEATPPCDVNTCPTLPDVIGKLKLYVPATA